MGREIGWRDQSVGVAEPDTYEDARALRHRVIGWCDPEIGGMLPTPKLIQRATGETPSKTLGPATEPQALVRLQPRRKRTLAERDETWRRHLSTGLEPYRTIDELCAILRRSRSTVSRWIADPDLDFSDLAIPFPGGQLRFRLSEVEDWLRESRPKFLAQRRHAARERRGGQRRRRGGSYE